jgi:phosphate/sulfate permease
VKIPRSLYARAGLGSLPVTAFAPLVGAATTGHGAPWVILPVGSMVAFVGGTCGERRAAASIRRGVVVSDPPPAEDGIVYAVAPRDEITVEYRWSDEAAA